VTVSTLTDWLRFTAAGIKVFENIKLKEHQQLDKDLRACLLDMKRF